MNSSGRPASAQGFSIVELLIVLGLMGGLLATSLAALEWTLPDWRVRAAAVDVATTLRAARIKALIDRTAVAVPFDVSAGQYSLITSSIDADPTVVDLPQSVSFARPDGTDLVTLEPTGTSDTAGLFNPRGQLESTTTPGTAGDFGTPVEDLSLLNGSEYLRTHVFLYSNKTRISPT